MMLSLFLMKDIDKTKILSYQPCNIYFGTLQNDWTGKLFNNLQRTSIAANMEKKTEGSTCLYTIESKYLKFASRDR